MTDSLRWNGKVWVAQIDLGRRPDGRQIKRKRHLQFPNTKDGERAARAAMGDFIDSVAAERSEAASPTVAGLFDRWIESKAPTWSEVHRRNRRAIADGKIIPRIGDVRLIDLDRATVDAMYTELRASGGRPNADGSMRRIC